MFSFRRPDAVYLWTLLVRNSKVSRMLKLLCVVMTSFGVGPLFGNGCIACLGTCTAQRIHLVSIRNYLLTVSSYLFCCRLGKFRQLSIFDVVQIANFSLMMADRFTRVFKVHHAMVASLLCRPICWRLEFNVCRSVKCGVRGRLHGIQIQRKYNVYKIIFLY